MARKTPAPNPLRAYRKDAEAAAKELTAFAKTQARVYGKVALGEFKTFRQRHLVRHVPGTLQLLEVAPANLRPVVRAADAWIRDAAVRLEKGATKVLSR